MSNWNPKPLRKADPNPLFSMEDDSYVVKAQTPIQRQRAEDGSPHTNTRLSGLHPKDIDIYLDDPSLSKGEPSKNKEETKLDPDEVIKSYLNKSDEDEEDTEKAKKEGGIAAGIGNTLKTAANTATKVVGAATGLAARARS